MMLKQKNSFKNQDLWITSYADLVSAILAVLVLMVSFSKIDIEKYDNVQKLIIDNQEQTIKGFTLLKDLKLILEKIALKENIQELVNITLDKEGIIITYDSNAQFEIGKYSLKEGSFSLMKPLFDEIIKQSKYRIIEIAGYTDDLPSNKLSNWELSALRALAVQKELEKHGLNNKNVKLIANAENNPFVEYKDKTGKELENARSKNRRVSIIIKEARIENLKK